MDEYNRGMNPEVKRYFKRIINSFSLASMWLLSVSTAGLFFQLAIIKKGIQWYNILFYFLAITSLVILLLYLYKLWSKKVDLHEQ